MQNYDKNSIMYSSLREWGWKSMRVTFLMKCTVCGEENYLTEKNKKNTPDRIEQKKFCSKCQKQTLHKEKTKK